MDRRTSAEVMDEWLPLTGATVVDVGCGDGWLVRMLTAKGAHVTGVEVSPKHLAHARSFPTVGDEHYLQGIAEDLPLPSRSADIVIFFNSLHHVDKAGLPKAMREAARVLKPGGILFVSEPLAEGDYFDLMKPVHDETQVRKQAQDILKLAPEFGLLAEKQLTHIDTVILKDFDAFHDRLTSINPQVRERFIEREDDLRDSFARHGRQNADGSWSFDQPMRALLLRRA